MDQGRSTGAQQPDGLRERNVPRPNSTGGRDALTATGELEPKDEVGKDKKTFGRTPDGTGGFQSCFQFIIALCAPNIVSRSRRDAR